MEGWRDRVNADGRKGGGAMYGLWKAMVCAMAAVALGVLSVSAADTPPAAAKPQVTCPVMGGPVNKDKFVDAEGYRIYVCCDVCVAKVKADPKKYIAKIRANGEEPAKAPPAGGSDAGKAEPKGCGGCGA
jgi:hypothetical protein